MRIFSRSPVSACAVVVWMLVLSAAATELYYERPDNDSEYQIENENKLEPVAVYDQLESAEDELRKSRLLVTLLQYVQHLKDIEDIDNKGPSPKDEDEGVTWSELFGLKEKGVKRWMVALSHNASSKLMPRWKIKKGTSVVCYFKLCSFKQSA